MFYVKGLDVHWLTYSIAEIIFKLSRVSWTSHTLCFENHPSWTAVHAKVWTPYSGDLTGRVVHNHGSHLQPASFPEGLFSFLLLACSLVADLELALLRATLILQSQPPASWHGPCGRPLHLLLSLTGCSAFRCCLVNRSSHYRWLQEF